MVRIGVDIGGTKANIGLIDSAGSIVAKRKLLIPAMSGPRDVLSAVKDGVDRLLLESRLSYSDVEFCGVGVPGTVSADGRTAVKVPNLGWQRVQIADMFEELTGVFAGVIQDSRAAAWGEYVAGAGAGKQALICFTLGTGIGTGIVLDGSIYGGARGSAGEIGHNPAVENGRACGCGKRGCLEKYAAGIGLRLTASETFGRPVEPPELFDMAGSGDTAAAGIIADAVELLGRAIVSAVNLLSPDCVLLSGGLSEQAGLFAEPLIRYIGEHCYTTEDGGAPEIGMAKLGEDAPMVGAAAMDT